MNSMWHTLISIAQSSARIVGCVVTVVTGSIIPLGVAFLFAEVIGLLEEIDGVR